MKKKDITVGGHYTARVNGKSTIVRVDRIEERESFNGRPVTRFDVTNLSTGRTTVLRSAQKFINPVEVSNAQTKAPTQTGSPTSRGSTSTVDPTVRSKQLTNSSSADTLRRSESSLGSRIREATTRQDATGPTPPHVIVEARAGTGKTTTLVEGLKVMRGQRPSISPSPQQAAIWDAMRQSADAESVCFVAFNKSIATELQRRVPAGCDAMTMHSMGFKAVQRALGRQQPNSFVVQDAIAEIEQRDIREIRKDQFEAIRATEALVSLCKMNLVGWDGSQFSVDAIDDEDLYNLASHYDIDLNGSTAVVFEWVRECLRRALDPRGKITFDDMIWLPVVLNLSVWQYDLLLVDECLPGWTPVMMEDGGSKRIDQIQVGDRVRSFDTGRGRAKNCTVTATQQIPNQKPLVKIKARHNHKTQGNYKSNQVTCTVDHKVWTVNRGWQQAGDLQIGDTVIIETAATTTQKGKITKSGRDHLSKIHEGNTKGTGVNGGQTAADFNAIKGGNGRGPTVPQQLLHDALGDGWELEYVVRTGDAPHIGRGNRPTHYKIDLANPEKKIAVEINGASHTGQGETDDKKDAFLRDDGWEVFRYTNRQIARDFAGILQDLCPDGENCPMPATVESVEEIYITEHFVYDITVEDCHNFYANGVLVHNCQDLNRCQQALARKAGRRLILVGDPKQAIYGFAGADAESMSRMASELGLGCNGPDDPPSCVLLPLTVTRRCGKAIVAEANKIVPDFSAHETNSNGVISQASFNACDGYAKLISPGDMALCRVNAPLVSQCFRLLKEGRKANIQGRDVGQGLISTIKKLKPESANDLIGKLGDWLNKEQAKEHAKRNPSDARLIALQDRHDCLMCFVTAEGITDVDDVVAKIESIFTDDKTSPGVMFSSVHKAKGLEANRVFILMPEEAPMPHPMARSAWQREQEYNLLYVAITRAKNELVYVS